MYRRMRVPNVWREMDQLQQEMNRLMDSSLWPRTIRSRSFPAINLWASEDAQVITAEIPGIDPDQIDIEVSADTLTISGERLPAPMRKACTTTARNADLGNSTALSSCHSWLIRTRSKQV